MKVIFHGDDFGLTAGVNEGIIRAFREGLLTSASILASGEAAEEAMSLARDHPGLDLGVHLTLCDERPLLAPRDLSSIIPLGDRFPSRRQLLKRILTGGIDRREVAAEWRAQVEKLLKAGIRITHLDSHQFVHLMPGLLSVCLEIIEAYKIPFVRGSIVDPASLEVGIRRLVQWIGLALWSRIYASGYLDPSCCVIPSMGFLHAGGRLTQEALLTMLKRVAPKEVDPTMEVILHPGIGDPHTLYIYAHWGYDWKRDLDLLLDNGLKNELAARGIQTTSFRNEI
jgi:chitin disaccharide deacetylase